MIDDNALTWDHSTQHAAVWGGYGYPDAVIILPNEPFLSSYVFHEHYGPNGAQRARRARSQSNWVVVGTREIFHPGEWHAEYALFWDGNVPEDLRPADPNDLHRRTWTSEPHVPHLERANSVNLLTGAHGALATAELTGARAYVRYITFGPWRSMHGPMPEGDWSR